MPSAVITASRSTLAGDGTIQLGYTLAPDGGPDYDLKEASDGYLMGLFADIEPHGRDPEMRYAGAVCVVLPPRQHVTQSGIIIAEEVKDRHFMRDVDRGLLCVAVGEGVLWPEVGDRVHVPNMAQKRLTLQPRDAGEGCHKYQAIIVDALNVCSRVKEQRWDATPNAGEAYKPVVEFFGPTDDRLPR